MIHESVQQLENRLTKFYTIWQEVATIKQPRAVVRKVKRPLLCGESVHLDCVINGCPESIKDVSKINRALQTYRGHRERDRSPRKSQNSVRRCQPRENAINAKRNQRTRDDSEQIEWGRWGRWWRGGMSRREYWSEIYKRLSIFVTGYLRVCFEKYNRDNYIGCEYHDATKITIQDGHRRQHPLLQLPLLVNPEAL